MIVRYIKNGYVVEYQTIREANDYGELPKNWREKASLITYPSGNWLEYEERDVDEVPNLDTQVPFAIQKL